VSATRELLLLGLGQAVVAIAGLVYGKLTALYIPPDEWGAYGLMLSGMTLFHGFFVTPTTQSFKVSLSRFPHGSVIRFYSQILMRIYLIGGLIVALLVAVDWQDTILILVWIVAIGQGIYQLGNDYRNVLGNHLGYTITQVSYGLGNLLLFSLLIINTKTYTASRLWQSLALLNTIFASFAIWRLATPQPINFTQGKTVNRTELTQACRQYISPLLSLALWNWLSNYADRFLIRLYLTDADVGQYGMGYSIGSKMLLISAPLLAFLSPQVLQLRAHDQSSKTVNSLLIRYLLLYAVVAGIACLLFYVGRNWIGKLLLSEYYKPAFLIGPLVAIGYLFLTSIHILEVKWYAFDQTRFVLWHHIAGALLNIVLNFILIPQLGIIGAALATLLAFAGQFMLAVWLFIWTESTH
jgi:O-antigen/teichoic acid export membrane protein